MKIYIKLLFIHVKKITMSLVMKNPGSFFAFAPLLDFQTWRWGVKKIWAVFKLTLDIMFTFTTLTFDTSCCRQF